MKKIAVVITIMLVISFVFSDCAISASDPDINSKSSLLVELSSGKMLHGDNIHADFAPYGLVKVMSLLAAVRAIESGRVGLDDIVTVSDTVWFDVTETSYSEALSERVDAEPLIPGERLRLIDLLYCAYVGAMGEANNAVAEYIAGSVEAYVAQMNDTALELGCENTYFTNTHGASDFAQKTTAWDLYLIYREGLSSKLFSEIVSTHRYTVAQSNKTVSRELVSLNYLLRDTSRYYYKFSTGGKASAIYDGGYIGTAEHEGYTMLSVVLGAVVSTQDDGSSLIYSLSETRRLFEWGFSEFSWRTVLSETELLAKLAVRYGDGADYVNLRPSESLRLFIENDLPISEFEREIKLFTDEKDERVTAPIRAGVQYGQVTIKHRGETVGEVKLIADTSVDLQRLEFMKSQIRRLFSSPITQLTIALVFMVFAGYIALVIRYNLIRRERMRKIAEAKRRLIDERREVSASRDERR